MCVVRDRLTTQVAHHSSTRTRHLVTPVELGETLLALPASANHRFSHLLLDVGSHARLLVPFHLVATQRNVVGLLAQSEHIVQALF